MDTLGDKLQTGKHLQVDDFKNLTQLGVTLYDSSNAVATTDVAYSKGSVFIKLNVDDDGHANVGGE